MSISEIRRMSLNVIFTIINGTEVKVVEGYENLLCAVPCTGRKSSAKWDIIYLNDGDYEVGPQLTKKEVDRWMAGYVINELIKEVEAADAVRIERLNAIEDDIRLNQIENHMDDLTALHNTQPALNF